jgi:hypothetical protein
VTAAPPPARIQVVEREFLLQLSRVVVPAGPALIEVDDYGQDPHDLRLQQVGTAHVAGTPLVAPGGRFQLSVRLQPGTYRLWCAVGNHAALGMTAVLRVVRPAAAASRTGR